MRIFFLLLLAANLAFFYWHEPVVDWLSARATPPVRLASLARDDMPPLVLLRERTDHAGANQLAMNAGASLEATRGDAAALQPESTPAQEMPIAQPSVPLTSQRELAGEPRSVAGVCLAVGPWEDAKRAREALNVAQKAGMKATLEAMEWEMPVDRYWLVTQQRFDLSGARDMMRRMNDDGIKDIAIVALDGSKVVSLGLFSSKVTAERRRRELVGLGYTPELRRQTETRSGYLLRFDTAAPGAADDLRKVWQQDEPQLEWRESICP
ncbi:MAG: hypothetical protein LBV36_04775 [Chromatiales bacterium]|jgi:hypothetical protein|nr:hypothetical protein [Chromatiales bacterium]